MKIQIKEKKKCKHKYVPGGVVKVYGMYGTLLKEYLIIFCEKCGEKKELI